MRSKPEKNDRYFKLFLKQSQAHFQSCFTEIFCYLTTTLLSLILTTDSVISRHEQELLIKKLNQIEKKVIVGGENLLEKMEEQAKLLEESNVELEQQKRNEYRLKKKLEEKQVP